MKIVVFEAEPREAPVFDVLRQGPAAGLDVLPTTNR
jgi:hypothetical protein